jgi:hypothetical protein
MLKSIKVSLADRLGRKFSYYGEPGELLLDFLKSYGYPSSSYIAYENDNIVSEYITRLKVGYIYRVEMVRAYHLPDIMDHEMDGSHFNKNFTAVRYN